MGFKSGTQATGGYHPPTVARSQIGHLLPVAISSGAIIGISVSIIVLLFIAQHFGTRRIAFLFSPIIILWLLANFSIGIYNISQNEGEIFNVRLS